MKNKNSQETREAGKCLWSFCQSTQGVVRSRICCSMESGVSVFSITSWATHNSIGFYFMLLPTWNKTDHPPIDVLPPWGLFLHLPHSLTLYSWTSCQLNIDTQLLLSSGLLRPSKLAPTIALIVLHFNHPFSCLHCPEHPTPWSRWPRMVPGTL